MTEATGMSSNPSTQQGTVTLSWRSGLWLALFIFIVVTRFHHLGDKPFHHDESLYGKYIWNFHVGQGYQYDPMQHGPFMFHASQITLFLFGVNNYSIRILPALTGIALILTLFLLRKRFPEDVALFGGWLFAINPVFMYFQRFLRHDAFFSLFSLLIFFFLMLWFMERKSWQVYAVAGSISILFCIKENAFVTLLILFTFAFLKVIADMFTQSDGKRLGFRSIPRNIAAYPMTAKAVGFTSLWGISFVLYAAVHYFAKHKFVHWDKSVKVYWIVVFIIYLLYLAFLVFRGETSAVKNPDGKFLGIPNSFFRDSYIFVIGFFVFLGIFVLLYTTMTRHWPGFWGGIYKWFEYWIQQHKQARIAGPFHYYHHQMLIYAFLPMVVTLVGMSLRTIYKAGLIVSSVFIGAFMVLIWWASETSATFWFTRDPLFSNVHLIMAIGYLIAGTYCVLTYLWDKMYLKAFLAWWTLLSYLIYSYLQEKVPWLTMHIITPMILLAAIYLLEIFKDKKFRVRRHVMIGLTALMLMYSFHTATMLCWYHEADPTEQMVYVQTTYEVHDILDELEQMAIWTNQDRSKELPIIVEGNAVWPFYWYLRDWKNVSYNLKRVDPNRHAAIICDWEHRHQYSSSLNDQYIARRYGLRAWYLPNRSHFTKGKKFSEAWRWILLREQFSPHLYGSADICLYVRKDLAARTWSADVGEAPTVDERRPEPPKRTAKSMKPVLSFGRVGSGRGEFNEPKDVAVAQDGSIYVADNKNNRVVKFDSNGEFLQTWGKLGEDPGQFNAPTGIFVDDAGNVYVADTWNHRIQKFNSEGKPLFQFGDGSKFWAPKDVHVDNSGNIYVVNTGFHKIHKFSKAGLQLWEKGSKGDQANQFIEPVGITSDQDGLLYVTDTGNKRICVYDSEGTFKRFIPVYGWEYYYTEPYIAFDPASRRVVVTDSKNNRIEVFGSDGKFQEFLGTEGSMDGQFKQPIGITFSNGKLYVVDSMNHRVQVFDGKDM